MSLGTGDYALILGVGPQGFGGAIARRLAAAGMGILGVHFDTRATMGAVGELRLELERQGVPIRFFNVNAAQAQKREETVAAIQAELGDAKIRVLVHSLAFGALKPYWEDAGEGISEAQMAMTLDVMANSLVFWTQSLLRADLFRSPGGRILAMTSAGSHRVWPTYGAVSAAKAALEAHIRQLAVELAPLGITANALRAGVTDTPALRKIPGNEQLIAGARAHNPHGRLTTPEDVADLVPLLVQPGSHWLTGNVLGVDGGEDVAG